MPRRSTPIHSAALALLASTAAHAGTPGCPDAGSVLSEVRISEVSGGFGGTLDASDRFGTSLANIGDLDGDGVADMAVGAYLDDDGGTDRGAVWILFLNADGTVKAEQKISDISGGFAGVLDNVDGFGHSIAELGDLDEDGVPDLAVGAREDDDGGTNRGAIWILFLNANGTVKAEQKISNTTGGFSGTLNNEYYFGWSLSLAGDLDGDGVADLIAGAPFDDDGGFDRGAVWVLFLNANGTVKSHQKISDTAGGFGGVLDSNDVFGFSVGPVGDLDGDGLGEVAVGALFDDDGGFDRGAVWILFLNANGTVRADQKISSTAGGFAGILDNEDRFGNSISTIGDLDGDGVPELALGASADDDGGLDRGAFWVLFLNPNGSVKAEVKVSDTSGGFDGVLANSDRFGGAVRLIGDLNGDDLVEVAVSTPLADDGDIDAGAVWILTLDDCFFSTLIVAAEPESVVLPPGGGATQFAVTVIGDEPLVYRWRKDMVDLVNGGDISGADTNTLVINADNEHIGFYDCVITNAFGQANTVRAALAIRQSCAGDFDGDFDIDFADLNRILGAYNTICP